jgi:ATP-dependent helicase/nuclease subunit A
MSGALELIRAGAGSGKTYDLCETVAAAVRQGLDPSRIMATTFTKKAAAELKGRIQSKLLAGDGEPGENQRNADRLELAAIGTVHSVAHRILSRYAVHLGLSTRLEVMTEEAANRLVSHQLSELPKASWKALVECAGRFGIDDSASIVLTLLNAKRGNQIGDDLLRSQLNASASRVCELMAPQGNVQPSNFDDLLTMIGACLSSGPVQTCTTNYSKDARQKLQDLQSLRIGKWGTYAEASRVKGGKTSGADAVLAPLRAMGQTVRNIQELHNDIVAFASMLADHVILIEAACKSYKTQRGLVDFTDLETLFLEALSGDQLVDLIEEDFSLVLVDEFQDTNPLQLAIFQAIRKISPRSRWVGDPKQAIFGFRGTDPGLVARVWEHSGGVHGTPLVQNRRSQKGLVEFVSDVFTPVFGEQAKQTPHNPKELRGLERWLFDTTNQENDPFALAAGIRELQSEGIRLGDIAVLERNNMAIKKLAYALEQTGIDFLFESPGLLSTREGVMTLAGMRLVLDRNDSLAAATLKHMLSNPTENTPQWIIDRLQSQEEQRRTRDHDKENGIESEWHHPWDGDPDLLPLEAIDRKTSSPHSVCGAVIEGLGLSSRISTWGNVAQRSSNLDSILKHVAAYEEEMLGSGQAATLGGAILYLEMLASGEKDIKFPPYGQDAVTILTYHKAKGLQWPVVILSGLHSDRGPSLWEPHVSGGGENINQPLIGRSVRVWTWPFGKTDGQFPKLRTGTRLELDVVNSPEGLQRAAEEQDENMRLLYVGCTRAESKLVFAHRAGADVWLQRLPAIDSILPINVTPGEHDLDEIDTTFVLRQLAPAPTVPVHEDTNETWLLLSKSSLDVAPRFHSPSQAQGTSDSSKTNRCELITLTGDSYFPSDVSEEEYAALGHAVHAYMAAIPSLIATVKERKLAVAEKCLVTFGVEGKLASITLVEVGNRFSQWVTSKFPDAKWRVEVPVTAGRADGGAWNGTLDLILELPDRKLVIIDHKSAPIRRSHCEAKALQYAGQLDAYEEALTGLGHQVDSTWIHFPLAGIVAQIRQEK